MKIRPAIGWIHLDAAGEFFVTDLLDIVEPYNENDGGAGRQFGGLIATFGGRKSPPWWRNLAGKIMLEDDN